MFHALAFIIGYILMGLVTVPFVIWAYGAPAKEDRWRIIHVFWAWPLAMFASLHVLYDKHCRKVPIYGHLYT